MAAGDIKGDEAVVLELTAGTAVTKGNLVHMETDGKFDPTVDGDKGKFAVAIESAAGDTSKFRAVVWGPVEVVVYGTASKGEGLMPGTTAGTVAKTDHGAIGENCGTTMEAMDTSGNTYTMWVGLVE